MEIAIDKIIVTKTNPREILTKESIEQLAESMKKWGQHAPVVLKDNKDGTYELVIGRRRIESAKLLKWGTIDARFTTEKEAEFISLEENLKRVDLTEYELINFISQLQKKYILRPKDLVHKLGWAPADAAYYCEFAGDLRNDKIPQIVIEELKKPKPRITTGHYRILRQLGNKEEEESVAKEILEKDLTIKDIETTIKRVVKIKKRKEEREKTIKDIEISPNQLIESDNFNQIPNSSIDLIIANPTKMRDDWGEEDRKDRKGYLNWIRKQIQEFERVLLPNGQIYIFIDKILATSIWDIFTEESLIPKNLIVFHKVNPIPNILANYSSSIEFIIWAVKGSGYTFNKKHPNEMHNHIEMPICGGKEKYTEDSMQKPIELIKHFIEISSNKEDFVLDPYGRVGTTAAACIETGRKWVLIEKNNDFIKIIKKRIEKYTKKQSEGEIVP